MALHEHAPDTRPMTAAPEGPTLVDLLLLVRRHRRLMVVVPTTAVVIGLLVGFLTPKTYTAVTRILPPQQSQSSAAAMLAQLGGATATLASSALGIKNPSDLYVGMLKSDTVANALIERFDLKRVYGTDLMIDARRELGGASAFAADRSGIITVRADARDPALAASLANAYIEELQKLTGSLAMTEASQRRKFFELQLQQTKDKLAAAETELRKAIEKGGLVSVDAQSQAALETVGRLRAHISAKEIELEAMRAYATPEHPDLLRASQELASMRRELARLESGDARPEVDATAQGLGSVKLLREVKYQEVMFELLARQYELARVDEARQAPLVQVLDHAAPPERKSRPQRALILLFSLGTGLGLALTLAWGREWWEVARPRPGGESPWPRP